MQGVLNWWMNLALVSNASTHVNVSMDVHVQGLDCTRGVDSFPNAIRILNEVREQYDVHVDAILDYKNSVPEKSKGQRSYKVHQKSYHPWIY